MARRSRAGRIDNNLTPIAIGSGKAKDGARLSSPFRIAAAAASGVIMKGMGKSLTLVIGVSTKPGLATISDTPAAASSGCIASHHACKAALLAQ